MIQECCPVRGVKEVAENVYVLSFHSPGISRGVQPGQFLNIKVADGSDPLLRRPFSVYNVDGDTVEIVFNVIGRGTSVLRAKSPRECIDVIGPLGKPFSVAGEDFETGVLLAGGLGVAPMPMVTRGLRQAGKEVITFLGARTRSALTPFYLDNIHLATDDGSEGYHGTVIDLARQTLAALQVRGPKLFACGPTAMLRAVADLAQETGFPCEVSLEGPMACGFGICQGCPVELKEQEKKYALMCKDGPVFDVRTIRL
jgi:dihydroorotate dehydrogenase electron transfer subunit